jgi:hypothetical protein
MLMHPAWDDLSMDLEDRNVARKQKMHDESGKWSVENGFCLRLHAEQFPSGRSLAVNRKV